MSQNVDICSTFDCILKNGKFFCYFFMNIFLDSIKLDLGPK